LGLFAVEHLAPPLRPEDSTGTMGTTALGTSNMLFPFDQSGDKLEVYDHLGQLVHSSLDGSGSHHGHRSSSFSPLSGPLSFFGQRDRLMVSGGDTVVVVGRCCCGQVVLLCVVVVVNTFMSTIMNTFTKTFMNTIF
jgi:hypothetical protein